MQNTGGDCRDKNQRSEKRGRILQGVIFTSVLSPQFWIFFHFLLLHFQSIPFFTCVVSYYQLSFQCFKFALFILVWISALCFIQCSDAAVLVTGMT